MLEIYFKSGRVEQLTVANEKEAKALMFKFKDSKEVTIKVGLSTYSFFTEEIEFTKYTGIPQKEPNQVIEEVFGLSEEEIREQLDKANEPPKVSYDADSKKYITPIPELIKDGEE
jgi:hypothetical protein